MSRPWLPSPPTVDAAFFPSNPQQSNGLNMEDWNQAGNFVNKPVRGWLHPDTKLSEGGITYGVRYVGCLEVNTSMKSLDFDTRSLIAKECINKLCEAAGLKTADKKRKVDKRLLKMIAEKPNMDHAGANVNLTITSSYLNLVSMENGDIIAHHEMPKISFASGGDADTLDFVSYVAKDNRYGRACFVLECGGGLAQDVITTIGQAFELRYKQFLKIAPGSRSETEMIQASAQNGNFVPSREDPEYYNDLPGKVPPDIITSSTPFDNTSVKSLNQASQGVKEINSNSKNYPVPYATTSVQKEPSDSLIDFSSSGNVSIYRRPAPEYVNTTAVISNERNIDATKQKNVVKHDIFDMQPFVTTLSTLESEESPIDSILNSPNATLPMSNFSQLKPVSKVEAEKAALLEEPWFHGAISRAESEALVVKDGDFLVRESLTTPGQYVLTGMQKTTRKHLLLVDPEGVQIGAKEEWKYNICLTAIVKECIREKERIGIKMLSTAGASSIKIRTKDQVFDSVSHLIKHHQENSLPIISAESALLLRTPVCRVRSASKSVQV